MKNEQKEGRLQALSKNVFFVGCMLLGVLKMAAEADSRPATAAMLESRMQAWVVAGGQEDDPAFTHAKAARTRCAQLEQSGQRPQAARMCEIAEAAFALARERALLALARARYRQ